MEVRTSKFALVGVIVFGICGCHEPLHLTQRSTAIVGGGPRLGRYVWLTKASQQERKKFWENLFVVPKVLGTINLDVLLEHGTKEEKEKYLPAIAAKVDWKLVWIDVHFLYKLKSYSAIFRTNPEFDKAVHRGILNFSSQIKATSEELGKMDFDRIIRLSEADSLLDQ